MSRSYTPKYRAEYRDQTGKWKWIIWNVRGCNGWTGNGQPSKYNAERLRKSMNESFNVGGVNYAASEAAGYIIHINRLRVVNQSTGKIVAEAVMPMFEVM